MAIDYTKSMMFVQQGVSAVCSLCEHFNDAFDRGDPKGCGQDCGGPMAGRAFDRYKGPLTDLSLLCFVCGSKPTHAVKAVGNLRTLGCCSEHVDMISRLQPENRPAVNVTMKSATGEQSSDEIAATREVVKIRLE